MDIMSMAQLLGNLGEFFGAVAVAATLVYLTIQVKQNTKTIETNRATTAGVTWAEWRLSIARDRELAEVYRKGLRGRSDLDAVDQFRFDLLVNQLLFNQWGSMSGGLTDTRSVLSILKSEGVRESYEAQKTALLPEDFVEAIDAELKE
jgi:hypothetical protein